METRSHLGIEEPRMRKACRQPYRDSSLIKRRFPYRFGFPLFRCRESEGRGPVSFSFPSEECGPYQPNCKYAAAGEATVRCGLPVWPSEETHAEPAGSAGTEQKKGRRGAGGARDVIGRGDRRSADRK
ncbi:hypothetical protein SKAU_G00383210 [Synaphobranchus kaupii]|uniref:Uncharacterized protein n=1 Tax=Synaphobranchus kaupii TaxID=118154 RepID=A0A9Q1EE28_SYNKA|nr:hypothetical protein SKAU_G00383210 [Synaphobranchus kaupii]